MQKRSKRLCLALAVLLSVSMVLAALVPAVEAASYKKGSSGAVVTQIQTKLKSWGYYTGTVDGIYGSGTERAVRAFQQKNGLTVDGKAGDQTLAAMGLSAGGGNSSNSGGSGGAVGYLLKERVGRVADFLHSLDVVVGGGVVIDPEVVSHLMKAARAAGSRGFCMNFLAVCSGSR